MNYICKLNTEFDCPMRLSDGVHCNNNTKCGFCVAESQLQQRKIKGYVRKERWYEKYYR